MYESCTYFIFLNIINIRRWKSAIFGDEYNINYDMLDMDPLLLLLLQMT